MALSSHSARSDGGAFANTRRRAPSTSSSRISKSSPDPVPGSAASVMFPPRGEGSAPRSGLPQGGPHALELAGDVRARGLVGQLSPPAGGQTLEPLTQLAGGAGERQRGEQRGPLLDGRSVPIGHQDEVAVV